MATVKMAMEQTATGKLGNGKNQQRKIRGQENRATEN